MSYLQLKKLEKRYSKKGDLIVKGIDLEIEQGKFIVLLGPSGCGKTTVLRMISGLEDTTGGDICLDGQSIVGLSPRERGISMIFQSYAVWPHMTVYENISYALRLQKRSKEAIESMVQEAAEICDIVPYLKRYPAQLSGGQRQRVAVARALAVKPKLFLMDEPLSNLDAKLRVSMRTDLKNIHLTSGATTVFVTHDQAEAMSLADRIVVMRGGVIEQVGTPQEVYHDCESIFVASFIGTPPTNFFSVTISHDGDTLFAQGKDFRVDLDGQQKTSMANYVGKEIIMGIRPEKIALSDQQPSTYTARITTEIVEPQGSHTIIFTHLGGAAVKILSTDVNISDNAKLGTPYFVTMDSTQCLFFDKITEKRIR